MVVGRWNIYYIVFIVFIKSTIRLSQEISGFLNKLYGLGPTKTLKIGSTSCEIRIDFGLFLALSADPIDTWRPTNGAFVNFFLIKQKKKK